MPIQAEYEFSTNKDFRLTDQMKADFNEHGYILMRGLFTSGEMALFKKQIDEMDVLTKHGYGLCDGTDRESKLAIWSHPGNDVSGLLARVEKVAGTSAELLGGEVYHYHSKLIMKEARTGGSFVWHQDYGYWYQNGNLFPDMLTAYLAIDHQDETNGGLQILPGTHKAGRISHLKVGGQNGADLERVEEFKKISPLLKLDLNPGDVLFFHCNVLHRSDQNASDTRRYALTMSYNRASNNPVKVHHHPQYTKLNIVPNSALLRCNNFTDMSGKEFLDPRMDETVTPSLPDDFDENMKA